MRRRAGYGTAVALFATIIALAPATSSARSCQTRVLTAGESGRSIVLHPCDRLTLRLTEASDGGYLWAVARRPRAGVLKLVSQTRVPSTTCTPPCVGGNDTHVYVYRATGAGRTALALSERRPFEPHAAPIARFTVTLEVR
jgi:predicted secreted protein